MALKFEVGDMLTGPDCGLDKHSLGRCTFIRRSAGRCEKYIPEFARDTRALQAVARQVAHVLTANGAVCKISDYRVVDEKATNAILTGTKLPGGWKPGNREQLAAAVRRAHTYTGIVLRALWGCWRVRWSNRDVADELELSIDTVRRILRLAIHAADKLGFKTYAGHSYVPRNGYKTRWSPEERAAQAARIRKFFAENPARRIAHGAATARGMARPEVRAKLKRGPDKQKRK